MEKEAVYYIDGKQIDMIVNCLRLRKTMYDTNSTTARELQNAVDMLTAKCYKTYRINIK